MNSPFRSSTLCLARTPNERDDDDDDDDDGGGGGGGGGDDDDCMVTCSMWWEMLYLVQTLWKRNYGMFNCSLGAGYVRSYCKKR